MRTIQARVGAILSFVMCFSVCAIAQETPKHGPQAPSDLTETFVEIIPYEFHESTLQGRVEEAMSEGKKGNDQPLSQLMDMYKDQPDQVLDLLNPYLKSTDENVQFSLILAASLALDSQGSIRILAHLAPNQQTGHEAIRTLYDNYTANQIIKRGGRRLKTALLRSAINSQYTTHGYLLLSCYKNDERIMQFLQRRRKAYKPVQQILEERKKYGSVKGAEEPRDTTTEAVTVDLALAGLGDNEALQRIKQLLQKKPTKEVVVLLQYLKFVNNTTVLAGAVEQLNNKAVSQETHSLEGKLVDYSRVCDEAMKDLRLRFDPPKTTTYEPPRRFSDAELLAAYNKYSAMLAAKP